MQMATLELSATQIALFTLGWGTFCGLVGWFANFGLSAYRIRVTRQHTLEDARAHRRSTFLSFLSVWASDADANRRMVNQNNVLQTVADRFDKKRLEFIGEAAQIEPDFEGDKAGEFTGLVKQIATMTPGQIGSDDGRKRLFTAINDL